MAKSPITGAAQKVPDAVARAMGFLRDRSDALPKPKRTSQPQPPK